MTTVAHCSNNAEAMVLKSLLVANGVETFLPEELTPEAGLHFAGSGLRIQVNDEDAPLARQILNDAQHPKPSNPE